MNSLEVELLLLQLNLFGYLYPLTHLILIIFCFFPAQIQEA